MIPGATRFTATQCQQRFAAGGPMLRMTWASWSDGQMVSLSFSLLLLFSIYFVLFSSLYSLTLYVFVFPLQFFLPFHLFPFPFLLICKEDKTRIIGSEFINTWHFNQQWRWIPTPLKPTTTTTTCTPILFICGARAG